MSIYDFDDLSDSFGFMDEGVFAPTVHFDGEDLFYLDDPSNIFNPTVHFDGDDSFILDDIQPPGNPHLVKFDGEDEFTLQSEPYPTSRFRRDTFRGADSILFQDNQDFRPGIGQSPRMDFPIKFVGDDDSVSFIGEPGTFLSWRPFAIKNLAGSDSFGFIDSGTFLSAGYLVAMSDTIRFSEGYTFQKILGPNNKTGSDIVAFTDSGTFNVAKGSKDNISFSDFGCICLKTIKAGFDTSTFRDRGTLWLNNRRLPPPNTLPGTGGSSFKVIIRWNRVEGITFLDRAYRHDLDDNIIEDPTCCEPAVYVPGQSWALLETWGNLETWGDLIE